MHATNTLATQPVNTSEHASFFLPGAVHLFGNLLLTVQGNVLHAGGEDPSSAQDAVLEAVKRGTGCLNVLRALMGENSSEPGLAAGLLEELAELGRVACRERGLLLEVDCREAEHFWVTSNPFVDLCGAAVHRWVQAIPAGTEGTLQVACALDPAGSLNVHLSFAADPGSLPFPLTASEILAALQPALDAASIAVSASSGGDHTELSFPPHAPGLSFQP